MRFSGGYDAEKFVAFKTATLAVYRVAHIAINVEILDLQIFAGARQIFGKPVTDQDYERSRRIIENWIAFKEPYPPVGKAAWHACRVLRDSVMNLDEGNFTDFFHYPWCLYLASLTCWAFHLGGASRRNSDQASQPPCQKGDRDLRSEMATLVIGMTSRGGVEDLCEIAGLYKVQAMIWLSAKQLESVRWAVMREGAKVLEGLCTAQNS